MEQQRAKWIAVVACLGCAGITACVSVAAVVVLARRKPAAASAVATSAGGRLELGEVAIVFPPGAVAADVTVSARPVDEPPSPDPNLASASRNAVAIEAAQSVFGADVTLELPYDPALVPAERLGDLRGAVWTGVGWKLVPCTVDAARERVVVTTRHFSHWSVKYERVPRVLRYSDATLPFDVAVAAELNEKVGAGHVAAAASSIAFAYSALTARDPRQPFQLGEPPHDPSKRLTVLITDIGEDEELTRALRVLAGAPALCLSDEMILVQHDQVLNVPSQDLVHEFVHAIQWRALERARAVARDGGAGEFRDWIGEAMATWLAGLVVPALGPDETAAASREFCYRELMFHSLAASQRGEAVPPEMVRHQYEGHVFFAYLFSRFGAGMVATLHSTIHDRHASERDALDAGIRALGDGTLGLDLVYKDFVLAYELDGAFGPRRLQGRKQGALEPPAGELVDLEVPADGSEAKVELPALDLHVPSAVRVVVPAAEGDAPRSLELTLSSSAPAGKRWVWAIAVMKDGTQRNLGGDAERLALTLGPQVDRVLALPVSMAQQTLVLAAKATKGEPPAPTSSLIKLEWKQYDELEGSHRGTCAIGVTLQAAGVPGQEAAEQKLIEEAKKANWARLEVQVGAKRYYLYERVIPVGTRIIAGFGGHVPAPEGREAKEVVVTARVLGQTATARRTFPPDEAWFANHRAELPELEARIKGLEGELEKARAEPVAELREQSEGLYASMLSSSYSDLGGCWRSLCEPAKARAAWDQAARLSKGKAPAGPALMALDLGDLAGYESLARAAGMEVDYGKLAEAHLLHRDDPQPGWKYIDEGKVDRALLFGYIPMRDHVVLR